MVARKDISEETVTYRLRIISVGDVSSPLPVSFAPQKTTGAFDSSFLSCQNYTRATHFQVEDFLAAFASAETATK